MSVFVVAVIDHSLSAAEFIRLPTLLDRNRTPAIVQALLSLKEAASGSYDQSIGDYRWELYPAVQDSAAVRALWEADDALAWRNSSDFILTFSQRLCKIDVGIRWVSFLTNYRVAESVRDVVAIIARELSSTYAVYVPDGEFPVSDVLDLLFSPASIEQVQSYLSNYHKLTSLPQQQELPRNIREVLDRNVYYESHTF